MTESTLLWQTRIKLHLKNISKLKIDANGARAFMWHFLCGVETVKRFVDVHLHCNDSNLKNISYMMTLPPSLEKFLRTPMAIFTIQQALRYGQDRLQLTICELKTKQNIMITMTQPFLNIFLFANNCSNGKNLHTVRFIHIVYS